MANSRLTVHVTSAITFDAYNSPHVSVSFVAFGGPQFFVNPGDIQVNAYCSGETSDFVQSSKLGRYVALAQDVLAAFLASICPDGSGLTLQQWYAQHGGVPVFDYTFLGDSVEYLITPEAEAQLV